MAKLSPDQLDPRNMLEYYTKDVIRNSEMWTDKLLRSEYARLRSIAQKRLSRLEKNEPGSYAYKKNVGKYPATRETSTEEIKKLMPQLAKFIAAKTGSVMGIRQQRRAAVETLQEAGNWFITMDNYKQFSDFMAQWRAEDSGKKQSWGSDEVLQAFQWSYEHGIEAEDIKGNFNRFMAQQKKLETYVKKQSEQGKEVSTQDILNKFEQLELQRKRRNEQAQKRRGK